MRIQNNDVLMLFRDRMDCECPDCNFCRNKPIYSGLDPAHISARGTGDHKRLDIPCNLVSLCRGAHTRQHQSNRPSQEELLAIAASREEMPLDEVMSAIFLLRRTVKLVECDHTLAWIKVGKDYFVCLGCGIPHPENYKPIPLNPGEF